MYLYWILLFIIILSCLFARKEHFEINDFYSRYINDISVPQDFYSQTKYANNYKFVEFSDEFFTDVLKKNTKDIELEETTKVKKYPPYLLQLTNENLLKILNAEIKENNLFSVIQSIIRDVSQKDSKYILNSQHVVYRDSKIYGAAIELTTLHENYKVTIIKSKLLGFIFQDRLNPIQPSNLITNNYQDYMLDKVITKDPKYEKQFLCQYYKDLQNYKNMSKNSFYESLNCDD